MPYSYENLAPEKHIGKKIVECVFNGILTIVLSDGTKLEIDDVEQQCCESRFTHTDDDPNSLIGGTLLYVIEKEIEGDCEKYYKYDGEYDGVEDLCFIEVGATSGHILLVNHNIHNGYYAGFEIRVRES